MQIIRFFIVLLSFFFLEIMTIQFMHVPFFPFTLSVFLTFLVADNTPWYVLLCGLLGVCSAAQVSHIPLESSVAFIMVFMLIRWWFNSMIAHNAILQALLVMIGVLLFIVFTGAYVLWIKQFVLTVLISLLMVYLNK